MNQEVTLLKKLVSIPSYVTNTHDENKVGEFVFRYLKQFPFLRVRKQIVLGKRFNVIAETKDEPRLMIAGHLDTVEPKQGWIHPVFEGVNLNDRFYGLGALDTKGGVAAVLTAISEIRNLKKVLFVFYCDEEYDFLGMKKFLNEYSRNYKKLELAIAIEPTDLKIGNAHRGLIEITFSVLGKSGHAARPESGKSANQALMETLVELRSFLISKFSHPFLGSPSLNIAFMQGGLFLDKRENNIVLGRQGNNIPDYAEAVIDIRTTSDKLSASTIKLFLKKALKKKGALLSSCIVRHDLHSFFVPPRELSKLVRSLKKQQRVVSFLNPAGRGYSDGQMIRETLKIPVVYLGPSGEGMHAPNEHVSIHSLQKLKNIYQKILISFGCA